ncbi:hypothetical protein CHL67_03925 [Prosthecochloris sp. GSB1]|uniref:ComEC/Rec2 family competence protein n=1 Tax=Prosthecochloris sp. GSB1 TaxID=281093 RepID=UPI000B8CDBF8|nr:ComEC/Rec2 family competence protein [Prosthecochloris sp. GSB1]ASQ90191.1 hypothetical protein CHL67_03925 [Prosthecochloris sp. GSB1]
MQAFFAPYPALRLLLPVCTGILTGIFVSLPLRWWLALFFLSAVVLTVSLVVSRSGKRSMPSSPDFFSMAVYTSLVFSGFAAYSGYSYNYVRADSVLNWLDREVLVYGKVASRPKQYEKGAGWTMEVKEVFEKGKTSSASGRIRVFLRLGHGERRLPETGDMVRLKGRPELIEGAENPGDFDPREFYRMQGVHAELFCAGPRQMIDYGVDGGDPFEFWIVRPVRRYLDASLDALLPAGQEREFFKGLLLGSRDRLDPEVYRSFRTTGTAHVLAISGLHVGLIAVGLTAALQRFRTTSAGRWAVFGFVALVLFVYAAVTGSAAPVKRASLMTLVLLGGSVSGRRSFPLNSLAAADLVLLFLDPLDLFSAGFLMTNAAVAAIILLYPPLSSLAGGWPGIGGALFRPFWQAFSVSLAAIVGVSPLIAFFFDAFSFAAFIANLPVVLLVSLMLYAILPALLLNLVMPSLALLPAASAWLFSSMALDVTAFFGSLDWASVDVHPGIGDLAVYYPALILTLFFTRRKKAAGVLVSVLCTLNLFVWRPLVAGPVSPPPVLPVNVTGTTALLVTSGGSTILVDIGKKPRDIETIERQMRRNGIASLAAAVQFTAPDSLVASVGAPQHMLSTDRFLKLSSFVLARPERHVLRVWSPDGSSMLLASGIDALSSFERDGADRVFVCVKRFGIAEYRALSEWLDSAAPKECVVIRSPRMRSKDRALLAHLAGKRTEMTVP